MEFLLRLHGEIRWLVLLAAAALALRSLAGWARGAGYRPADRILTAALTGLLDLNLVLGLVLLFRLPGGLMPHRVEHATTMLVAVVAGHLSVLWRRSEDASRKFRNNGMMALIVLALLLVGVLRLRGGWIW